MAVDNTEYWGKHARNSLETKNFLVEDPTPTLFQSMLALLSCIIMYYHSPSNTS